MTPSADQPYGIGPDQKKYKIPTVAERAELRWRIPAGSNEGHAAGTDNRR